MTINQVPYLSNAKEFSKEAENLAYDVNRAYVSIANAMNSRTIGIFPANKPAATGEGWYLSGTKQQTLRQVYSISAAGSIPHGIDTTVIAGFTKMYGTFTNGTNFYPLPLVDTAAITSQISVHVTATDIVITAGVGAPALTSGFIILEWLSSS